METPSVPPAPRLGRCRSWPGRSLAAVGWLLCAAALPAAPARGADPPAPVTGPPAATAATAAPARLPGAIEEYWARGEAAFEAGDLDEALRLFGAARALDERRARSWNYLGGVHFAQGDLSEALRNFRRALELDPGDVRACNNLGTTLERLGDYGHAREAYLRAALVDPSYPVTQRNLGILEARRLGNPDAARRAWRRYLELAPSGAYADEIRREIEALDAARPPAPR